MDVTAATPQTNLATLGTNAVSSDLESVRGNNTPADNEVRESRQASQFGPAVISKISASTLESSRATNATGNTVSENRVNDQLQAQATAQSVPSNEQLTIIGNQTLQQSRIDTVV